MIKLQWKITLLIIIVCFGFSLSRTAAKEPIRVQTIRFFGKLPVSEAQLKKIAHLKDGMSLTLDQIKQSQKTIVRFLTRKGYLQARIDSVSQKSAKTKDRVNLIFWVHAGPLFHLNRLIVQSDSIPQEAYLKAMRLRPNAPFEQDVLEKDINRLMRVAAEKGFPFVKIDVHPQIKTDKRDVNGVILHLRIREGKRTFIKGVFVKGNHYTKPNVILRAVYFKSGMLYRQSWMDKIVRRLQKLEIFKSVSEPQMVKIGQDSVIVVIRVEEGNATTFDGIVGYVPKQGAERFAKQRGYFTGLLNFSFQNLFGTGRKLKIYWEKTDQQSENFLFSYWEPWVFQQPLDVGISFARDVKDTLFIAWDFKFNSAFRLSENFGLFLNVNRHSVVPDSTAQVDLGLVKNRIYNLETGIRYDTRDYPFNPRKGIFYRSSYRFGLKENLDVLSLPNGDQIPKRNTLSTLGMQFEGYQSLFQRQVLAVKLTLQRIKGSHLQLSDYFWFGGSRSVRGYREKQFSGYLVSWMNLEYRFITGFNSRVFVFTDFGYYENKILNQKNKFLQGMGLGLRFSTPLGIMGVDYGLAKGESFRQGKIHFGLTNKF